MRKILLASAIVMGISTPGLADHPTFPVPPVNYRFEPIPPLGNNLPRPYRERMNRPRYFTGWLSYVIEPTSQEAMSWHENVHRGSYKNHAGRCEPMYFYPKPWEVLTIGPRTPSQPLPLPESELPQ